MALGTIEVLLALKDRITLTYRRIPLEKRIDKKVGDSDYNAGIGHIKSGPMVDLLPMKI